jgi:uncharacterized protein with PIN domain
MGQAKSRGTFEERKAQAIARERAKFPDSVDCNNCGHKLTDIEPMDVRNIEGMRLAGGSICPECGHTTWTLGGSPEGLADFQEFLSSQHQGEVKMGFVSKKS